MAIGKRVDTSKGLQQEFSYSSDLGLHQKGRRPDPRPDEVSSGLKEQNRLNLQTHYARLFMHFTAMFISTY